MLFNNKLVAVVLLSVGIIAAAPAQAALAVKLAQFFTTSEQQTELTRQTKRVPSNSRVWIAPRVYPAVSGFAAQSRTAIALPNIEQTDDVQQFGNDVYIQMLAGILEPQQAAQSLTDQVNDKYGFERAPEPVHIACDLDGTITVWFLPQELDPTALEIMRDNFQSRCPDHQFLLRLLGVAGIRSAFIR